MLEPDQQDEQRATLAELLRELRQAAGLSGERPAARCAMSQAKISRIETGKILPSVIDVEQIVAALAVPDDAAEKLVALARVANVGYTSWRSLARTRALARSARDQGAARVVAGGPTVSARDPQRPASDVGLRAARAHFDRQGAARA
jgi:transcriptional regulator with XRE-family HTH domain